MKLLITVYKTVIGNKYQIAPIPDTYPIKLAEVMGGKVVLVTYEEGEKLLARQEDYANLQLELEKKCLK